MGSGNGVATITSGIEGAWTTNPIAWDNDYLKILLENEWNLPQAQEVQNNGFQKTE